MEVLDNGGKIVLSGVGKSGHIGKKIAATLASTGSPAVFMHPVEALHGDLGILQKKDILIALSYSGETDELVAILPPAKLLGVPIVAITGFEDSNVARHCDITIRMKVDKEACPFNLAPTTTAISLLALGDALAIVLLEVRGFTKEDYGRCHPGGAIGRAVTMRICDIMRTGDQLALVKPDTSVKDCLFKMTKARCGSAIVIDENEGLMGIFTDGDFRRHAEDDIGVLEKRVSEVMTLNPASVKAEQFAAEALKIIQSRKIDDIIALDDDGKVVGLVDIQDLPGLKLM
jgi:arabinose-5-phosphate isomerase